jgi:hypothetical protein
MNDMQRALNRLAKWRNLLAGWQLGTRATGDPECDAVRDIRELLLILRAEQSAIANLLMRKGVITEAEWCTTVENEANLLSDSMALRFPGFQATDVGLEMHMPEAGETMRRFNFK